MKLLSEGIKRHMGHNTFYHTTSNGVFYDCGYINGNFFVSNIPRTTYFPAGNIACYGPVLAERENVVIELHVFVIYSLYNVFFWCSEKFRNMFWLEFLFSIPVISLSRIKIVSGHLIIVHIYRVGPDVWVKYAGAICSTPIRRLHLDNLTVLHSMLISLMREWWLCCQ